MMCVLKQILLTIGLALLLVTLSTQKATKIPKIVRRTERTMPPDLLELNENYTKIEDDLQECMKDFGACLTVHKRAPICAVDADMQSMVFENICEYQYENCKTNDKWIFSDNKNCPTLEESFEEPRINEDFREDLDVGPSKHLPHISLAKDIENKLEAESKRTSTDQPPLPVDSGKQLFVPEHGESGYPGVYVPPGESGGGHVGSDSSGGSHPVLPGGPYQGGESRPITPSSPGHGSEPGYVPPNSPNQVGESHPIAPSGSSGSGGESGYIPPSSFNQAGESRPVAPSGFPGSGGESGYIPPGGTNQAGESHPTMPSVPSGSGSESGNTPTGGTNQAEEFRPAAPNGSSGPVGGSGSGNRPPGGTSQPYYVPPGVIGESSSPPANGITGVPEQSEHQLFVTIAAPEYEEDNDRPYESGYLPPKPGLPPDIYH